MKDWTEETLHAGVRIGFEVERRIAASASDFQSIEAIENAAFGTVLLLDGATQVTTRDEFAYHEMMAHVPLVDHGAARRVLIVGGGDCGLAEEVLKHAGVERVVVVEIDPAVVSFAREHMSEMNAAAHGDKRCQIRIADAARFVAETDELFDVVLIDSTDPVGPGAVLFTEQFYRDVARCLSPGGIVVAQAGVPFLQRDGFVAAMGNLGKAFASTSCYLVVSPTYFGGHMALAWASNDRVPFDGMPVPPELPDLQYYTPAVHVAAFALPKFIEDALKDAGAR